MRRERIFLLLSSQGAKETGIVALSSKVDKNTSQLFFSKSIRYFLKLLGVNAAGGCVSLTEQIVLQHSSCISEAAKETFLEVKADFDLRRQASPRRTHAAQTVLESQKILSPPAIKSLNYCSRPRWRGWRMGTRVIRMPSVETSGVHRVSTFPYLRNWRPLRTVGWEQPSLVARLITITSGYSFTASLNDGALHFVEANRVSFVFELLVRSLEQTEQRLTVLAEVVSSYCALLMLWTVVIALVTRRHP